MRPFRLFLLFLCISIPVACGGPEAGTSGSGSGRNTNRGGSAGSTGGTDNLGGSAGDFSGLGGDFSGSGGFAGETDAEPSDAGDAGQAFESGVVTDGAGEAATSDAAFDASSDAPEASADARSDATTNDASTISACTAQPQNDSNCGSGRPPHRYTCPLSVATPSGCVRTGTNSTTAFVCCP